MRINGRGKMRKNRAFDLRKEGKLDEALAVATEELEMYRNLWNLRAYIWVLADLLKTEKVKNSPEEKQLYEKKMRDLGTSSFQDKDDRALLNTMCYLLLGEATAEKIKQASNLFFEKNFREAILLYEKLAKVDENIPFIAYLYAKTIYHYTKDLLKAENYSHAKRILYSYFTSGIANYMKSEIEEPSRSSFLEDMSAEAEHHHWILVLARITKKSPKCEFDMGRFAKLWDLKYLSHRDFTATQKGDIKYPSLAASILKYASQDALKNYNKEIAEYLIPYIDKFIKKDPENYGALYKTRCYQALQKNDEAEQCIKEVIKNNPADWAWKFLGELYLEKDENVAFSCFCRSLQHTSKIKSVRTIKLALALLLIKRQDYSRAKTELEEMVKDSENRGYDLLKKVKELSQEDWYETTKALESNKSFYYANSGLAESIAYNDIPWQDAFMGGVFENKENKKKQTIYLITKDCAIKISCSISKIPSNLTAKNTPVKVKYSIDSQRKYRVYMIEARESHDTWENISPRLAVVYHINEEKKIAHLAIDRQMGGILQLSEIDVKLKYLDVVEVHLIKKPRNYNARFIKKSDQPIPPHLIHSFIGQISTSGNVGFVDDIFIPADLLAEADIDDADFVEGMAVLNYNKKREAWGWKAYQIVRLEESD